MHTLIFLEFNILSPPARVHLRVRCNEPWGKEIDQTTGVERTNIPMQVRQQKVKEAKKNKKQAVRTVPATETNNVNARKPVPGAASKTNRRDC